MKWLRDALDGLMHPARGQRDELRTAVEEVLGEAITEHARRLQPTTQRARLTVALLILSLLFPIAVGWVLTQARPGTDFVLTTPAVGSGYVSLTTAGDATPRVDDGQMTALVVHQIAHAPLRIYVPLRGEDCPNFARAGPATCEGNELIVPPATELTFEWTNLVGVTASTIQSVRIEAQEPTRPALRLLLTAARPKTLSLCVQAPVFGVMRLRAGPQVLASWDYGQVPSALPPASCAQYLRVVFKETVELADADPLAAITMRDATLSLSARDVEVEATNGTVTIGGEDRVLATTERFHLLGNRTIAVNVDTLAIGGATLVVHSPDTDSVRGFAGELSRSWWDTAEALWIGLLLLYVAAAFTMFWRALPHVRTRG